MTYRILPLLAFALMTIPQIAAAAPVNYDSMDACRSGAQAGQFAGEVSLDCAYCTQDERRFTYEPGAAQGTCSTETVMALLNEEIKQQKIKEGYVRTSQTCSFSDNKLCPQPQICMEDGDTGSGYCYRNDGGAPARLVNLLKFDTVEEVIAGIMDLLVQVGSILLVFALVLAGFRFVSAQGSPGKIEEARNSLTWVVIGGLLLLGAEAISLVIKATVESL